jgi:hypothetical protein
MKTKMTVGLGLLMIGIGDTGARNTRILTQENFDPFSTLLQNPPVATNRFLPDVVELLDLLVRSCNRIL